MDRRSVLVGMVIAGVVIAGIAGVGTAIDKLNGPGTPEVTVERINDTHAAVSWTTETPANGTLYTFIQPRCNESWLSVARVNGSTLSRTHLVVAPIYTLNRSDVNQTFANLSNDSSFTQYRGTQPVRYKVNAEVWKDGSVAGKTIYTKNITDNCQ